MAYAHGAIAIIEEVDPAMQEGVQLCQQSFSTYRFWMEGQLNKEILNGKTMTRAARIVNHALI
jgi:hypothetical protein